MIEESHDSIVGLVGDYRVARRSVEGEIVGADALIGAHGMGEGDSLMGSENANM